MDKAGLIVVIVSPTIVVLAAIFLIIIWIWDEKTKSCESKRIEEQPKGSLKITDKELLETKKFYTESFQKYLKLTQRFSICLTHYIKTQQCIADCDDKMDQSTIPEVFASPLSRLISKMFHCALLMYVSPKGIIISNNNFENSYFEYDGFLLKKDESKIYPTFLNASRWNADKPNFSLRHNNYVFIPIYGVPLFEDIWNELAEEKYDFSNSVTKLAFKRYSYVISDILDLYINEFIKVNFEVLRDSCYILYNEKKLTIKEQELLFKQLKLEWKDHNSSWDVNVKWKTKKEQLMWEEEHTIKYPIKKLKEYIKAHSSNN